MSGGFPTGGGHFDLGYIRKPQKTPGEFSSEDYQKMSSGLANVGLKCKDNTPDKMEEYVDDVRKSLPTPGADELTALMCVRDVRSKAAYAKQNGYQFVLDPTNVNVSKMDVVIEHIKEIHESGTYFVGQKSTSSTFQSSTIGTIKDAFKAVGNIISDVQGGKVDPGQIMNTIADTIASLTETTSKTFDQTETKTLFCIAKPDEEKGTAAAICGLKYTYEMHVKDITDKKEKSHQASYSMTQWNVVFTDSEIFDTVYKKFAGGKSA